MTEDDFLERMDRYLVRLDAHIEQGNELMAAVHRALDANSRALDANSEAFGDLRGFVREQAIRLERVVERWEREAEWRDGRMEIAIGRAEEELRADREERRRFGTVLSRLLEPGSGPATA